MNKKKKYCYGINDEIGAINVQKEICAAIKECKDRFKQRLENMFKKTQSQHGMVWGN